MIEMTPARPVGSLRHLALVLSVVVVASCSGMSGTPPVSLFNIEPTTLGSPRGGLFGLAWPSSDWLVVNSLPVSDVVFGHSRLWRFRPDGSMFEQINLPEDSNCRLLAYVRPVALSDGRLGYDRECRRVGMISGNELEVELGSIDLRTGTSQQLAPVASGVGASGVASFDWDPRSNRGLISIGSGICQGIEWIDEHGLRPIDLVISDGDRRFNLADEFTRPDTYCSQTGRTDNPALSWTDGRVAFFASPASAGVGGQARLDARSNLYIADPELRTATLSVRSIGAQGGLGWSPDGRWLAFTGEVGDLGAGGWLFDVTSSRLMRFSSMRLDNMAWSPDGSRIAAMDAPGPGDLRIHVFDVKALLASGSPP